MDKFTWDVDVAGAVRRQSRPVNVIKFGDGYEQRQPQGIAPALSVWQAAKTGDKAEVDAIEAFLLAHCVEPFLWTPCAGEREGRYVLDEGMVSREALGKYWRISWTAREVRA